MKLASTPTHPMFASGQEIEASEFPSEHELFQALVNHSPAINFVFVPVENSTSGTFGSTYDLLMEYTQRAFIVGEHVVS